MHQHKQMPCFRHKMVFVFLTMLGFMGCDSFHSKHMTIFPSSSEMPLTDLDIGQICAEVSSIAQRHGYMENTHAVSYFNSRYNEKKRLYSYSRATRRGGPLHIHVTFIPSNSVLQVGVVAENNPLDEVTDVFHDIAEELSAKHPSLRIEQSFK